MIPEGNYKAKKVGGGLGHTKNGNEEAAVIFELVDAGEYTGQNYTWYGYFTEQTEERTLKTLRALGVEIPSFRYMADPSDVECSLKIVHKEYNGKTSPRVAFVNFGNGGEVRNPMTDEQRAAFTKRLEEKLNGKAPAKPAAQGYLPPTKRGDAYEGPEMPDDDFFGSADKAFG